jgi:hypothetical protein
MRLTHWPGKTGQGRKQFFFEKKNQKTFAMLVGAAGATAAYRREKSFLVLFFKKELLSWLPFLTEESKSTRVGITERIAAVRTDRSSFRSSLDDLARPTATRISRTRPCAADRRRLSPACHAIGRRRRRT